MNRHDKKRLGYKGRIPVLPWGHTLGVPRRCLLRRRNSPRSSSAGGHGSGKGCLHEAFHLSVTLRSLSGLILLLPSKISQWRGMRAYFRVKQGDQGIGTEFHGANVCREGLR